MEGKFYQAAITGDERLLNQLVDSISVDGAEFVKENPLHVAAKYGRPNIVREILRRRPKYAFGLNWEGQTPLHLASAEGHLLALKELLDQNNNDQCQQQKLSDACFIRDSHGKSPLHLAAMNGHVEVLRELVETESAAAWVCTDGGQSLLHLCANNDHFDGVEGLIGLVSEKVEFINLKDYDGNNVLHLLAAKKQYKMIQRLVNDNERVAINATNRKRDTVIDVAVKEQHSIRDSIEIFRLEISIRAKERTGEAQGLPYERPLIKALEDILWVVAITIGAITLLDTGNLRQKTYWALIAFFVSLIPVFAVRMFIPIKVSWWVVRVAALIVVDMVATITFQAAFHAAMKRPGVYLLFIVLPLVWVISTVIKMSMLQKVSTWILVISTFVTSYFLNTDLDFTAFNYMDLATKLYLAILLTVETLFPRKLSTWGLIIATLIGVSFYFLPLLSSDDTFLVSVKKYLIQHVQVVTGVYLWIISMYKFFTEHVQVVAGVCVWIMFTYKFFISRAQRFLVGIFVYE